jgi:crotonobetainyl-CoA:carnitine CoA-transferase CaiB-like acyl-CoA transferase
MSNDASSLKIWLLPVIVVVAIGTFAATFYAYAERHRLHQEGSPFPAIIGIGAFVVAMIALTAALLPRERRGVGLVLGIVIGETVVFAYALMFLLLNIYGS